MDGTMCVKYISHLNLSYTLSFLMCGYTFWMVFMNNIAQTEDCTQ